VKKKKKPDDGTLRVGRKPKRWSRITGDPGEKRQTKKKKKTKQPTPPNQKTPTQTKKLKRGNKVKGGEKECIMKGST